MTGIPADHAPPPLASVRRKLVALLMALALAVCAAPGITSAQDVSINLTGGNSGEIDVPLGQSRTVRVATNVGEIVVGEKEIADVFPLTDRSFYVIGKRGGRTNVAIYDPERRLLGTFAVEVSTDTSDVRLAIGQAAPGANIEVQTVNGQLRLSGTVPDAITLRNVLDVAEQYAGGRVTNALTVRSSQQVMLEVRFVEVRRSAGRELGINLDIFGSGQKNLGLGGRFGPARATTGTRSLPSGSQPFGTFVARLVENGINVDILIQALEEKGLARLLAEPNLVALSGQTASFLAGGEVPIPIAGTREDGETTVTIQFKEFGVRLNFTPVVLNDGLINITLQPEVSQPDPTVSIQQAGILIPGFVTRRATTTVELRDGQSFAIAGLLQVLHTKQVSQLPWIGQIPILGALFRSSSYQKEETDLVIIVTPHLVKPAKPGQPLRTPLDDKRPANDVEFFLLGMLEVDNNLLTRFATGDGIEGPFGHIVDLPPEAVYVHQKK